MKVQIYQRTDRLGPVTITNFPTDGEPLRVEEDKLMEMIEAWVEHREQSWPPQFRELRERTEAEVERVWKAMYANQEAADAD